MLLDDARRTTTRVLTPRLTVAMASLFVMIVVAFQAPGPVYFAAQTTTKSSLTPASTRTAASTPIPRAVVPEPTAVRPEGPPVQPAPRQVQPAAVAVAEQEPPIMRVPVAVTDSRGRFITGLEKDHFKVFEDDVEQSVADLTSDRGLSVAVVLAIQNGAVGSGVLRQTMEQLLGASNPEDEFWSVEEDTLSRLQSSNTSPPILSMTSAAAEKLKSAQSLRRVILIISDGNSQVAANVQGQISAIANEVGAQIYAISLTPLYSSRVSAKDEVSGAALLDAIAEDTGGRHYSLASATEVQNTVTRITVEVRYTYWVGYVPSNRAQDGSYRKLLIEIAPPLGIPRLNLHGLPGYIAPGQKRGSLMHDREVFLSLWDQNVNETALHASKSSATEELTCVS
jgi:Ca-activated chloride channel homolog